MINVNNKNKKNSVIVFKIKWMTSATLTASVQTTRFTITKTETENFKMMQTLGLCQVCTGEPAQTPSILIGSGTM